MKLKMVGKLRVGKAMKSTNLVSVETVTGILWVTARA